MAKIVLCLSDGMSVRETARHVGVNFKTVLLWRDRFRRRGLGGLQRITPGPAKGSRTWAPSLVKLATSAPEPPLEPPRQRQFNPRPAGVIVPGSASDAVFRFLGANDHIAWVSNYQIEAGAKPHLPKTVRWSLVYLRSLGLVDVSNDNRNSRWLKYRLTDAGREALRKR